MTSQEAEGWWSPIGDFRHLRYQFFPFFKLSLLVQDCDILFRIFPEVLTILQIPLSPRFKVSNLFLAPPSSKIRSSHLYYTSNLFILFIQAKPVVPVVPVILVIQVTLVTLVIPVALVTSVVPVISVILVRNMVKFTVSSEHKTLLSLS